MLKKDTKASKVLNLFVNDLHISEKRSMDIFRDLFVREKQLSIRARSSWHEHLQD